MAKLMKNMNFKSIVRAKKKKIRTSPPAGQDQPEGSLHRRWQQLSYRLAFFADFDAWDCPDKEKPR
jgi:hypothetical protein